MCRATVVRIPSEELTWKHAKLNISFFRSTRSPYYVYAQDYRQTSAGVRVLHLLCHALNELGEEAYIANARITAPGLRTPLLTDGIIRNHFRSGRLPVAVYPEVVSGNPLSAPIVARWLLNRPGHIDGDSRFDAAELLFYFGKWCLPEGMTGHPLQLPAVDTDVFHDRQTVSHSRKGLCYYANKYRYFGGLVDPEMQNTGINLGLENHLSRAELAEILRSTEVMYCYEPSSLIYEALVCGCPVLIVPSAYWEAHGAPEVLSTPGVVLATAPNALSTATAAMQQHDHVKATKAHASASWRQVENFVAVTSKAQKTYLDTATKSTTPWFLPRDDRQKALDEIDRHYAGKVAVDSSSEQDTLLPPAIPSIIEAIAIEKLRKERLPSIELIVVATEPGQSRLAATLASAGKQDYPALVVTVVAPPSSMAGLPASGQRCLPCAENHWLAAREALAASSAEWAGIVRSGDRLAPGALAACAHRMINRADDEVLYSDTADSEVEGLQLAYHFLPAFDIDLLRAGDFPFGLLLARSDRWREAGGWRVAPTGLDTLDAALRLYERCGASAIGHLAGAFLIRHRNNQPYLPTDPQIVALRRQIVAEHLARSGVSGEIVPGLREELIHVRHPVARPPKVSLIIPTKDNGAGLEACIRSVLAATDYPDLECLVIDNGTVEPGARAYLDNLAVSAPSNFRVAAFAHPFNPGAIANAAAQLASGELLLFLHDDVEALQPGWIHALVEQCLRPGVGMAGGRLLAGDGTLREAGIVPMQTGLADSPFARLAPDTRVTASRLQAVHQVSAISGACMMVRREVYEQVGGMDAVNFPARTTDIDFCLKVRQAGYRIMWTPYATLLHDSDGTLRGNKHDGNALLARWGKLLVEDPTFNPYLALDGRHEAPETDPAFMPDPVVVPGMPRVFAVGAEGSAAGRHRLLAPLRAATAAGNIRGRCSSFLPVAVQLARLGTDYLHALAPMTPHQLRELAVCRQLLGCKVVLELDGLLDAPPEGPSDQDNPFRRIRACLRQTETLVDRYVTNSAWLAAQLPNRADRISVVPDALDPAAWNVVRGERKRGSRLRIGWRGAAADLAMIAPAVAALADAVDWVFIGELPEALAACRGERHEAVPVDDYPSKLASLDLDLAIHPLAMTPRNHCGSHLPLLEYGYLDVPVIATDLPAHATGLPVHLIGNDLRTWAEAVLAYVQQPDMCQQHGETLRRHVLENWLLLRKLPAWQQLWQA